jgi:hypothetical protein
VGGGWWVVPVPELVLMLVVLMAGGWYCWCDIYSSGKSVSPAQLQGSHREEDIGDS